MEKFSDSVFFAVKSDSRNWFVSPIHVCRVFFSSSPCLASPLDNTTQKEPEAEAEQKKAKRKIAG